MKLLRKGDRIEHAGQAGTVLAVLPQGRGSLCSVYIEWDSPGVLPEAWLSKDGTSLTERYSIDSELLEGLIDAYSY